MADILEIEDDVLKKCTNKDAVSVEIPADVTKIGIFAFKNCNITELSHPCLTIKGGLAINGRELQYCASQASEIVIPAGVKKIGEETFLSCTALAAVEFGGTKAQWKAVEKSKRWHRGVPAKRVKCADGEAEL